MKAEHSTGLLTYVLTPLLLPPETLHQVVPG